MCFLYEMSFLIFYAYDPQITETAIDQVPLIIYTAMFGVQNATYAVLLFLPILKRPHDL